MLQIKITKLGLMTFRIEMENADDRILFETHAHNITVGMECIEEDRRFGKGDVRPNTVRIAGTILHARSPLGEMDWFDSKMSSGTPGWIDLPVGALQTEVDGTSLLAEVERLCAAPRTNLPEDSDSSGQYYSGWTAPVTNDGGLIIQIDDINIADMSSQSPNTDLCGFNPNWKVNYLVRGQGKQRFVIEDQTAGDHLLKSIFLGIEVKAEIDMLFRTMTVAKPPVISRELDAKLSRLGWHVCGWEKDALNGHKESIRPLIGRPFHMYVPVAMQETVDFKPYRRMGDANPPAMRTRIHEGALSLPLEMAMGIAIASYRAGWRPQGAEKLLALTTTTTTTTTTT